VKISIRWLEEMTGRTLDAASVADQLTRAGLEVESRKKLGDFSGVIVAEVRAKKPHPDAAKLTLVDVWDGQHVTQVVCGAPNVPAAGHKVLWARPGAKLPMGEGGAHIDIAAKAVRGIESPGMLCAEDELGLGESHAGIIVIHPDDPLTPGQDAAKALSLPDDILELAIGPNRPDCLSHKGIAQELGTRSTPPTSGNQAAPGGDPKSAIAIELRDPAGCPRYHASVFAPVAVGPSPLATRLRLEALGVRAISNVVDVTNLVMLELGQPQHAFDLDTLPGPQIIVRRAKAGEKLETLDGVTRDLIAADLLICDGNDRPIALAGVMGGKATEVTDGTKRILLECASFAPGAIRATAKRLGLPSEASRRFERGVDQNVVPSAFDAAARRLIAGGAKLVAAHDEEARPAEPLQLTLRASRTRALSGLDDLPATRQAELLSSIGIAAVIEGDTLRCTIPTSRPDLTREVDLIEEVLRLEGFDRVPTTVPPLRSAPPELKHRLADRARDLLVGLGLDEAVTYAFVAPRELAALQLPAPHDRTLRLANPLRDEQSTLRTSLLPGLVRAAARNIARGVADVRLFEVGHVFLPARTGKDGLPEERRHVALLLCGARDGWLKGGEPLDYFDLRGLCDELTLGLGHPLTVRSSVAPWLHPGVQGALHRGDDAVGHLGELHPRVAAAFDLPVRALVLELDLSSLPPVPPPPLRPIPRFPQVERDVSFLVDAARSAAEIAALIASMKEALLVDVRPREDYRDPSHVPAGKKSMLWSFVYQAADRTLTDAEVRAAHDKLVAALSERLALQLR
jgi:phenylalanyl-tRNA synthetase beta chain